jgi:hypothetical protein
MSADFDTAVAHFGRPHTSDLGFLASGRDPW